jgi:hypothetical protein
MNKERVIYFLTEARGYTARTPLKTFTHLAKCLIGELFPNMNRDEIMFLAGRLKFYVDYDMERAIYLIEKCINKASPINGVAESFVECLFGIGFANYDKLVSQIEIEFIKLTEEV